jgi:eukaryotic-like serine/threonine-protein kinase
LHDVVAGSGPLSVPNALSLGAGLAEAPAAIHKADLIHRELKPSNVLMAPDGPRVIDFGIARVVAAGAAPLTATGWRLGICAR